MTVVSIGECMVELARGSDGRFGLAYGGDTFNTAVYLARAGQTVSYATALGDDTYSDGIATLARDENVGTSLIARMPGRMPGLYLIETAAGERSFYYWRDRAPAREIFESATTGQVVAAMRAAKLVYFSGVTLSLYSQNGLDVFAAALADARRAGAIIAMDSNYRPRGWGGDTQRARATFARFWSLADMALPTLDDEQALWSDPSAEDTIVRLSSLGVGEIVVKNGNSATVVSEAGTIRHIEPPERITPLDTTAAGDSFNAAYIAARLNGKSPVQAALAGHRLAGVVIQHRGAIVPHAATAAVLDT